MAFLTVRHFSFRAMKAVLFAFVQIFLCSGPAYASEAELLQRGDLLVRDLQSFAASNDREFHIPKGDYLISPRGNRFHLLLPGMQSKKIFAAGARLIFVDPQKGGILIDGANNFIIEGGELTWLVKPFVAGKVVDITWTDGLAKVKLNPFPEYKTSVKELERAPGIWSTLHEESGQRKLTPWRGVIWVKLSSVAPTGQIELSVTPDGTPGAKFIKTGDILVTVARYPDAHAVLIHRSKDVNVDGIVIRTSPGMGIVATPSSSNLTIQNSAIKGAEARSWISTVSDGIHLVGTTGNTLIKDNIVDSAQDDAIVVSERGSWASRRDGYLEFQDDGTTALSSAEDFLIFPEKGEISFLKKPLTTRKGGEVISIAFQERFPGSAAGSKIPVFPVRSEKSSIVVEGNQINSIRGIGIRVCRPNVAVRGNTINLTVEQAIAAGPWLYPVWLPQMPALDIKVEGNTIIQPLLSTGSQDLRGSIEIGCWPLSWCAGRNPNGKVLIRDNKFEGGTGYARERIFVQ